MVNQAYHGSWMEGEEILRNNVMETDEMMILNLKWLLLTYMDTKDCGWKRLLKDLKKES